MPPAEAYPSLFAHLRAKPRSSTSIRDATPWVIGASDYVGGWPGLRNAVNDAREIAEALKSKGFTVQLLENPTGEKLEAALGKLVTGPGRDRDKGILIWFSGHGHTLREADGQPLGYVVPVDAPLPSKDEYGFRRKAVDMRDMETVARSIHSKHVVMVFDSCFSGAVFNINRAAPSAYIREKALLPVRQFISAGDADEQVPDRSVFKTVFIQAVRDGDADRNGDGYVTGEELGSHLQEKVINYSRGGQHPQYGKINNPKLDRGDFVFQLADGSVYQEVSPRGSSTGSLRVESEPDGAVLHVNGKRLGRTPKNISGLKPGTVTVKVERDGYEPRERSVTIKAGRTAFEAFPMKRAEAKKGRLYVKTQPEGARVRIMNIGPAYRWGMELAPGRYHVHVSMSGYEPFDQWVSLGAGQDMDVVARLERKATPASISTHRASKTWTEPTTGMEFVWVPGGCFQMGSNNGDSDEKPVHRVCVDGFWMGKYEVTQGQWQRVMGSNPSRFKSGSNYPVEWVSWNDAQAFIKKLNSMGNGRFSLRLPSEAEWEYAARSGTQTARYWGNGISCDKAMYENDVGSNEDSCVSYVRNRGLKPDSTAPVGSYQPNAFGLYDTLGNVWEWCEDKWHGNYNGAPTDGSAWISGGGSKRVYRGGSWRNAPWDVRSANRYRNDPGNRYSYLGFRLSRTN